MGTTHAIVDYSINHLILNKEMTELKTDGTPYGDGWGWLTYKKQNRDSLKKILTKHGWSAMGVVLGSMNWEGFGYQRVTSDNVKLVTFIGLDFDNADDGDTTDIASVMSDPFLSTASLGYTSTSHQKHGYDRFRLIWYLDKPMQFKDASEVIQALIKYFPGTDPAAKNPNRVWYGHKDAQVFLDQPTNNFPLKKFKEMVGDLQVGDPRMFTQAASQGWTSGQSDQYPYLIGFDDAGCDEIGLAKACLELIPSRGHPSSGTYHRSFAVLSGLIHNFGADLALEIIDEMDWEGPYWDIRNHEIPGILNGTCDNPSTLKTVIHHGRSFGLTNEQLTSFNR